MDFIYNNEKLWAINKPSGLPSQPDKSGDPSALIILEEKTGKPLHLINRLDRPVSGVLLFTDQSNYYSHLKSIWHSKDVEKTYLAIVEGKMHQDRGELTERMIKGRQNKAIIHPKGKIATLNFKLLKNFDRYTLLSVGLKTGRFHQIRCLLAHIGYPIKGDVKYGARRKNPDRNIHLHCYQIKLPGLPVIQAPLPSSDTLWKMASDY